MPRGRPKKLEKTKFIVGDLCLGVTRLGQNVSGFYMNSEGKHAWIKGWYENISKFEPKTAIKVLANSLRKPVE